MIEREFSVKWKGKIYFYTLMRERIFSQSIIFYGTTKKKVWYLLGGIN